MHIYKTIYGEWIIDTPHLYHPSCFWLTLSDFVIGNNRLVSEGRILAEKATCRILMEKAI